ncbi:tyrosine-type recombinase/integrase [Xanthomonas arboricola]|uniref:tyrosine-type recombinase/integrase n=1 Tax=Xanthomonas arboricola TaxID=56448 RepID=UPI00185943BB
MRKLYRANPARAPLWLFMAHTGLRRGEVAKLHKSSVQGSRLMIESEPDETGSGRTKSGKWREVPLNRYARWALRRLPERLIDVHKDTISDWFAADARKAGIGGSLHRLRHTFCAHLVMAGVPLRRVQVLAGHADYATTEKILCTFDASGRRGRGQTPEILKAARDAKCCCVHCDQPLWICALISEMGSARIALNH